jgi:hypothetical protein
MAELVSTTLQFDSVPFAAPDWPARKIPVKKAIVPILPPKIGL